MSGTLPGKVLVPSSIAREGICNMAIAHLKIQRTIGNLDTDMSAEAVACRTFYNLAIQVTLEDFKWPFAKIQGPLALLYSNPFPFDAASDSEWAYAYQYPSDCVTFNRIVGDTRNETRLDRVPYRIFSNNDGTKMILTDMDCAFGEWTYANVTEDMFSASLVLAISFQLAFVIAPMLTGGDPFKLGDRAERLYKEWIIKAQANALNEEQVEVEPESEFVEARGYRSRNFSGRGGFE